MKQPKEYTFKRRSLLFDGLLSLIGIGVDVYAIIKLYNHPLALLFALVIPGTIFYFQWYTFLISIQFNRCDDGKKITISDDRQYITLNNGNNSITINNSEVDHVEFYEQRSLGKFGTYNYLVIYTINGRTLLITDFTIPHLLSDSALKKFFSNSRRIYNKKTFNYINKKMLRVATMNSKNDN